MYCLINIKQTKEKMESFYDYDKFRFVEMDFGGKKHLIPLHYRPLGEKEGLLYSKKVSWSDVLIHDVPLEKTFEFEETIPQSFDDDISIRGTIIVNERQTQMPLPDDDEDYSVHQNGKWMNRLSKMALNPVTLPEAKKKRKSVERYPVKPKNKKEVRDEKIHKSSEKFQQLTDERDTKHMDQFFEHININKGKMISPYYPPEQWTKPTIQWDRIWSHMDELEHGKKRDYHFIKEGDFDSEGYPGPAIYFYEATSDDLNYDFDWASDYRWAGPWNRWTAFNPPDRPNQTEKERVLRLYHAMEGNL